MEQYNPSHPGSILKHGYLDGFDLSYRKVATHIGVSTTTLTRVINEEGSVTPDMAIRLEMAFGLRAVQWLALQANYDLWQVKQKLNIDIAPLYVPTPIIELMEETTE